MENNYAATAGYTKLFESFDMEGAGAEPTYPEDYGGAYIDENGHLVIQYVEDDDKITLSSKAATVSQMRNELKAITELDNISVEKVEYSYNDLLTVKNQISDYIKFDHMGGQSEKQLPIDSSFNGAIVQTAINTKYNRIIVWLEDISENNIKAFRDAALDCI